MDSQGPVAPFLKACSPFQRAVRPEGGIAVATQSQTREPATEEARDEDTAAVGGACAPTAGGESSASSSNGLGHHGEPAEPTGDRTERSQEEEVEGQEENEVGSPAKLMRAPRTPSQSERELHEAIHLPHAEWCEYCVRGRGRNKPHKSRSKRRPSQMSTDIIECPWEG